MPTAAPRAAKKMAAKKTAAAAPVTTRTGLTLDPADPEDAKILARQRQAARAAGREGQDRAKVAAGRPDLADEFDQGEDEKANEQAAAADEDAGDEDQDEGGDGGEGGPGVGERARSALGKTSGALSRGSYRPTLSPPTRARNAGGFAFGLLLYTAAITYIRYGPAGWKGWLSAKFLNKPLQGLPTSKGGPPQQPTTLEA